MPTRPLFVYGTLRDPDVLRLVLGRSVEPEVLQSAEARGCRVVVLPERTYPALRRQDGATAIGALIGALSALDLQRLDRFEGDEYARRTIEIIVSGNAVLADVYWPVADIPVDAADWSLADWTIRHKAAFLAAETAHLEQLRRHAARPDRD